MFTPLMDPNRKKSYKLDPTRKKSYKLDPNRKKSYKLENVPSVMFPRLGNKVDINTKEIKSLNRFKSTF